MNRTLTACLITSTTIAAIIAFTLVDKHFCPIQKGDKVYNSALEKRGTVRHLEVETCKIGVMYDDNTVSKQLTEQGGVSNLIDPWTVNKTK